MYMCLLHWSHTALCYTPLMQDVRWKEISRSQCLLIYRITSPFVNATVLKLELRNNTERDVGILFAIFMGTQQLYSQSAFNQAFQKCSSSLVIQMNLSTALTLPFSLPPFWCSLSLTQFHSIICVKWLPLMKLKEMAPKLLFWPYKVI